MDFFSYLCAILVIGSVAQLVEHDTLNVGVVGSRPTGTTQMRIAYLSYPLFVYIIMLFSLY